jgi:multimeric flavodoxin WrbA
MKVLAIMGSPRKIGNTYKMTKMVEESMKSLGEVDFEYIFLKDEGLKMCTGCRVCMDRGEGFCPLKDGRESIEKKIMEADSVIFASPTYVGNVSGLMKNFIDRFAYVCHRPRFFKNAMEITTSAGGGGSFMLLALSIALRTWGFKIVHKVNAIAHEKQDTADAEALKRVNQKKADIAAKKLYAAILLGKQEPGYLEMAQFLLVKKAHMKNKPLSIDYDYWKGNGWYEKDAVYFYDTNAGLFKRYASGILSIFLTIIAK